MKKTTKNEQIAAMEDDGREFAELLRTLSDSEKAQVKGIVIGLRMARDAQDVQATA